MKKVFVLLLILCGLFCAMPAWAQFEMDTETAAVLAQEAPLAQSDLDSFVKYCRAIDEVTSESELNAVLQESGLSAARMAYIYLKVGLVWIETEEEPGFMKSFSEQHPQLIPSAEEIALIEKNMPAIKTIAKSMGY